MPLINAIHDSLPYIDAEPSASERTAAQTLIDLELGSRTPSEAHPLLPPLLPSALSPLMTQEHERVSSKTPLKAIDLTRYEATDPPSTTPDSDEQNPETLQQWRSALERAYISHTYLSQRQTNLALLDRYGKNSWLVGNAQLEDILRGLERELAARKTEIDGVVLERKGAQDGVGGEVKGLEEAWRRGVGRVLETEVAAEKVRGEILERRRMGAM